jgi:hypothetical protein
MLAEFAKPGSSQCFARRVHDTNLDFFFESPF